jgi:outer membrane protein assembly factor BamD
MMHRFRRLAPRLAVPALLLAGVAVLAGCAATARNSLPPGTLEPDRFLYERGKDALEKHKWVAAREYFTEVFETYTQSTYRPDAKLGIGDTYMGEGTPEALVSAIGQFTEFLTFYPTHARADYAQYNLALAHFKQMRSPQRDQSETKQAVDEFETFIKRYPNSDLMPEAQARLREAKDRLGDHEYDVGLFYFHINWFQGAIQRFQGLLKDDPGYTHRDDVYYYLGESLVRIKQDAAALPYFAKLVDEFQKSDHLEDAKKRVAELTAKADPPATDHP